MILFAEHHIHTLTPTHPHPHSLNWHSETRRKHLPRFCGGEMDGVMQCTSAIYTFSRSNVVHIAWLWKDFVRFRLFLKMAPSSTGTGTRWDLRDMTSHYDFVSPLGHNDHNVCGHHLIWLVDLMARFGNHTHLHTQNTTKISLAATVVGIDWRQWDSNQFDSIRFVSIRSSIQMQPRRYVLCGQSPIERLNERARHTHTERDTARPLSGCWLIQFVVICLFEAIKMGNNRTR